MKFFPLKWGLGALAGWAMASLAQAHDFWIQPAQFQTEVNAWQTASLRIGHPGDEEAYGRNPKHLVKFEAHGLDPEGKPASWPLAGRPGASPAGRWRPKTAGGYTLAYRSAESKLTMEPAKFEAYLEEEGLGEIVAARRKLGESDKPGRESYSRCAKSLVRAGAFEDVQDRVVGLPLEFVLEENPFAKSDSPKEDHFADLAVRLELHGEALAGAQVQAWSLVDPDQVIYATTDREGQVRLPLTRGGAWMLSSVHMERAADTATDVDWVSLWASHCFQLGATR